MTQIVVGMWALVVCFHGVTNAVFLEINNAVAGDPLTEVRQGESKLRASARRVVESQGGVWTKAEQARSSLLQNVASLRLHLLLSVVTIAVLLLVATNSAKSVRMALGFFGSSMLLCSVWILWRVGFLLAR